MTVTLSISPTTETKLRQQATASGRDVAEYVTKIVEEAVTEKIEPQKLSP
jgi:hypothetical protein